jgi:protocatechuate 3,4-dioxygenase beta subunit
MKARRSFLALAVVLLAAVGLHGRQTVIISVDDSPLLENRELGTGTGLIMGRVVEAESNRPLGGVAVRLAHSTSNAAPDPVLTDPQGRFVFRNVPKGSYRLVAWKTGYASGAYAERLPTEDVSRSGRALVLDEDQRIGDVVLRLWRYAAVAGTVMDEAGEPVVGVIVRAAVRRIVAGRPTYDWSATFTGGAAPTARTDDRGRYRLSALVPGDWLVAVPSVTGALPRQREPAPSAGGPVSLSESSSGGGQWITGSATLRSNPLDVGDPEYVLTSSAGTPAGLGAVIRNGRLLVYPTQFYAGADSLENATLVTLGSGERRLGVNFQLRPLPAVRVSGRIMTTDGANPGETMLRLVSRDMDGFVADAEIAQTVSRSDGRFAFIGVPPGDYAIRAVRIPRDAAPPAPLTSDATTVATARGSGGTIIMSRSRPLPTGTTLFADTPVSAGDQGAADVTVQLRIGVAIRGRVQFEGTAAAPRFESITPYIEPADGRETAVGQILGRVDAKGNFATQGQQHGKYYVRVPYSRTPGWFFHGAMLGGRDLSVTPVDLADRDVEGVVLLFRDRPLASLAGTVTDDRGQPLATSSVIVFPADRTRWIDTGRYPRTLRSTGAGVGGQYAVDDVPPGAYFVAALADLTPAWADPSFLAALAATATRVELAAGEARRADLRAQRNPASATR